jgi:hypothetical protein
MEPSKELKQFSYERLVDASAQIRLVYLDPVDPDDPSHISLELKAL